MTSEAGVVIVAGTVSLDLVAGAADATSARAAVGNSGSNIAVRLARAGIPVTFACLIGDDAPGALVVRDLERWGVSTEFVTVRAGYRTPIVYQVTSGGGTGADAISADCPNCGRPRGHTLELPSLEEIGPALASASTAAAVAVDIAGPAAERLLERCGGLTWYEASLREASEADMIATAALATVVKASTEEADHYRPIIDDVRGRTRLQLLTAGQAGVNWRVDGSDWSTEPVAPIEAIDTIGAGDAFSAGTIAALLRGDAELEPAAVASAVRAGNALGREAVQSVGARGDMAGPAGSSPWVSEAAPFHCTRCVPNDWDLSDLP